MYAITNINVFNGQDTLENQAIIVAGDTIEAVVPMETANLPETVYDGQGLTATAGFIDLQLNGCGGVMLNVDISKQTLDTMNETNIQSGTTQYLPTLITSKHETMCQAVELISAIENHESEGIIGLHLEGPFISKEKKGLMTRITFASSMN